MNSSYTQDRRKPANNRKRYIATAVLFWIIGSVYKPDFYMDLYRYYQFADSIDLRTGIIEFTIDAARKNIDFVYFSLLYLLKKSNLSASVATSFFLALFFVQSLKFTEMAQKADRGAWRRRKLAFAFTYGVASAPIITTLSISRTVASIAILFTGINFLSAKFNLRGYALIALSFTTHIFTLFYAVLILISSRINIIHKIGRLLRSLLIIPLGLLAYWGVPKMMSGIDLQSLGVAVSDIGSGRYSSHLDPNSDVYSTVFEKVSFPDQVQIVISLFILAIGLMRLHKYDKFTNAAFILLLLVIGNLNFSTTIVQRSMIFLIPFQSFIVLSVLNERPSLDRFTMTYCALIFCGIIISLLNFYSYRYFFF